MLSDTKLLKLDALCDVMRRTRINAARVFSDETIAEIEAAVREGQRAGKVKIERELRKSPLEGDLLKSLIRGFEELLATKLKVETKDRTEIHHQSAWATNMDAVGYEDI